MRASATAVRLGLLFSATFASNETIAQGLPRARPEDVGLSATALRRIEPQLRAWVNSDTVAGIIAVVARHGKVAYMARAGSLDSARRLPIAEDAVYRIYSMTKPITSAAVMQLVERGKIRLADPVSKYIPAFANTKVFAGGSSATPVLEDPRTPITIAHLLTHTSGLTYGFFGNTAVDSIYLRARLLSDDLSLEEFADSIARLPLASSPGSAFNYSFSTDVLGRVVEVASAMPLDRYLDSAIFRPLGMRSTAFHVTSPMQGRITSAFERGRDGRLQAASPLLAPSFTVGKMYSGGGGLLSTIPDYLRFAQALLNGGTLDGQRILERETVALMMRNHLPARMLPILSSSAWPPGKNGFGYGGAVRLDSASTSMPGAQGTFRWTGYASTFFWIDPQNDLVAMLWSQYLPEPDIWRIDETFQKLVYAALRR